MISTTDRERTPDEPDNQEETPSPEQEHFSTTDKPEPPGEGLAKNGSVTSITQYRLYKARFLGCFGLAVLNGAAAMTWPWFGPIANDMVLEFGITLDQVNWLGNIISCIYLPTALITPIICSRYGIRRCCDIGTVFLLLSAWIRYAGTSRSLSVNGAYALLIVGQFCAAIPTAIFQILGPKYSENWFGLKGRTTATMIIAISYPIGGAIGQLISPLISTTRSSIFVLGIICTAVCPATFLIRSAPPTPPTHAGIQKSLSLSSLLRAMLGREVSPAAKMTLHERIDFSIVTLIFSTLLAALNTFAILTAEIFAPAGYSSDTSGFMGATVLLTGILAAIITAPLFDRVLTRHLAISAKVLVPIVAAGWVSLIWAVKPRNMAGLFVIMTILGVGSITLLPIGLELGCELTRNADGSSAILFFGGNGLGIVFLLVQGALRAGPDAIPPLNMRRALIFNGIIVAVISSLVFIVRGRQARRELDEQKNEAHAMTARVHK